MFITMNAKLRKRLRTIALISNIKGYLSKVVESGRKIPDVENYRVINNEKTSYSH